MLGETVEIGQGAVVRVGWSMELGDFVEAHELDHGFCKTFQVVCPACREAVFLSRPASGSNRAPYLSHHATADRDAAEQCELRVAAWTGDDLARMRSEGRQQTLKAFLAVFRESVNDYLDLVIFDENNPGFRAATSLAEVVRNREFATFLSSAMRDVHTRLRAEAAAGELPNIQGLVGVELSLDPAIRAKERERIALFVRDAELHLLNDQSSVNLRYLMAASAWRITMSMLQHVYRDAHPCTQRGVEYLALTLRARPKELPGKISLITQRFERDRRAYGSPTGARALRDEAIASLVGQARHILASLPGRAMLAEKLREMRVANAVVQAPRSGGFLLDRP